MDLLGELLDVSGYLLLEYLMRYGLEQAGRVYLLRIQGPLPDVVGKAVMLRLRQHYPSAPFQSFYGFVMERGRFLAIRLTGMLQDDSAE